MPQGEDTVHRNRVPSRGSSLLAISLLVLAFGCLSAVAVPIVKRSYLSRKAALVAADLKTFRAAFQRFAKEHGDWPDGGRPAGKIPIGMGPYLMGTHWSDTTPVGGHYQWCRNTPQAGGRYTAVIVIASTGDSAVTTRSDQLSALEAAVGGGNLPSGSLILGFRNFPVYVLEH